jgi:tetratricopeptide (TPR) repeat protein
MNARTLFESGDVRGALDALGPMPEDTDETRTNDPAAFALRGWVFLALDQPERAIEAFGLSHTEAALLNFVPLRIECLSGYAYCLLAGDSLAPARGLVADALIRARRLGDPALLALALRTRGSVLMDRCCFVEAETSWDEAVEHARSAGDAREESLTLECLAALDRTVGRPARGHRRAVEASECARKAGDRRLFATALATRASCDAALGDRAARDRALAEAQNVLDPLGLRVPKERRVEESWRRLFLEARAHAALGRGDMAREQSRTLLEDLRRVPPLLPWCVTPADVVAMRAEAFALCEAWDTHAPEDGAQSMTPAARNVSSGAHRRSDISRDETRSASTAPHLARLGEPQHARSERAERQRALDEIALEPLDDAPPELQAARRHRVEAQWALDRARRRLRLMGFEVPAGAIHGAEHAARAAWEAEINAHQTSPSDAWPRGV